mgnify:CR=1 FL=1
MLKFPNLAAATGLALALSAGTALAAGDAANGEKVFKRCAACHTVGEDAKHRVGPHLNDIIGRTAGSSEGFKYSKAMVEAGAGGTVWDEETLDAYLADPRGYIKGNRMSFAGLRKDSEPTLSPTCAASPRTRRLRRRRQPSPRPPLNPRRNRRQRQRMRRRRRGRSTASSISAVLLRPRRSPPGTSTCAPTAPACRPAAAR